MKKTTLLIWTLMVISFSGELMASCDTSKCNFLGNISNFYTWDTCKGNGTRNSINAYIAFKSPGCYKYAWTVNGSVVGTKNIVNYVITKNGTYKFCLKVTDTCNRCDTTVCLSKTITCFTSCNWKSKSPSFSTVDTCQGSGGINSISTYLSLNNRTCLKYQWTVNGFVKGGNNYYINYPVSKNGTYVFCIKVYDSCKKCDTTICMTKTVNCFNSCNFKGRTPYFSTWDSCIGSKSNINGYITFYNKNCLKYQWTVAGVAAGNGTSCSYGISKDGTYSICVKVTDTCSKCDTTFCLSITTSCFSNTCNWKSRVPYMYGWDTCKGNGYRNSVNAYISFGNGYDSCYKYVWTVNGISAGSKNVLSYPVSKNGAYVICIKITDTCKKCDTTICLTRNLSCFSSSCNWKSKSPYFTTWDTCNGKGTRNSINGYISLNNRSCLNYTWKVNGTVKSGNAYTFTYPITQNGTYTICVKVTDTCNKCDTVFCATRTITCFGSTTPCNFKGRTPYFSVWDSCSSTKASLYGYISFYNKTCMKYQWKVAGAVVGNASTFSYRVTKNGTYAVCVKVTDTCNNCDTTFCANKTINCKTLGFESGMNILHEISTYPNPFGDVLYLDWSGQTISFDIVNIFGSAIISGQISEGVNTFNTSFLANGIYTIRLYTSEGIRVVKIVLNR